MRRLYETLDHVERTTFDTVVYRHTSPAFSPLSGDGARRQGGRWNPPESYPVVYTALDVRTVDLELARAAGRAGLAGSRVAPRRLATIHVRLSRVLDLTTEGARASLGVSEADLVADDPSIPRAISEAAHHLGYEAVLAPSAAGAGKVLAIFLDNRAADSTLEVVDVQDGYLPDLDAG